MKGVMLNWMILNAQKVNHRLLCVLVIQIGNVIISRTSTFYARLLWRSRSSEYEYTSTSSIGTLRSL